MYIYISNAHTPLTRVAERSTCPGFMAVDAELVIVSGHT